MTQWPFSEDKSGRLEPSAYTFDLTQTTYVMPKPPFGHGVHMWMSLGGREHSQGQQEKAGNTLGLTTDTIVESGETI